MAASDNLRGIALIVLAMAAFAVEDMFIKFLAGRLPPGQIIIVLGTGGALVFAIWARMRGEAVFSSRFFERPVLIRNGAEVLGTMGFITALALAPLAVVSAIIQATPLWVTLGAALFMGEQVGPRRWIAIFIGLSGVLLVIQPWSASFVPASLFAVLSVIGLGTRDLATRVVPRDISTTVLSAWALLVLIPAGLVLLALPFSAQPVWPTLPEAGLLALSVVIGVLGYWAITAAMRVGEVSVVTPFRYSRIVFALFIAALVFDEPLEPIMLLGAAIVVGTGLYTLWRERVHKG